jgi:hypothetical protein
MLVDYVVDLFLNNASHPYTYRTLFNRQITALSNNRRSVRKAQVTKILSLRLEATLILGL